MSSEVDEMWYLYSNHYFSFLWSTATLWHLFQRKELEPILLGKKVWAYYQCFLPHVIFIVILKTFQRAVLLLFYVKLNHAGVFLSLGHDYLLQHSSRSSWFIKCSGQKIMPGLHVEIATYSKGWYDMEIGAVGQLS